MGARVLGAVGSSAREGNIFGRRRERQATRAVSDSVLILALMGERYQVVDGLAFGSRR